MEVLTEIWETIRRHKLRTAITGFSVAWGIFLLVVLLAVGKGLSNGVYYQFRDDAVNSIFVSPGKTMLPYQGMPTGRVIKLTNEDYELLRTELRGSEYLSGRINRWGAESVTYGSLSAGFPLKGMHPEHRHIENTQVLKGRYINERDINNQAKVVCIGQPVADFFFKGKDPIGEYLNVNGIIYKVIGVFYDDGGDRENRTLHIPVSTAQIAYNEGENLHTLMFTITESTLEFSQIMEQRVRELLAKKHKFDPRDPRAIYVNNNFENFVKYNDLIVFITYFVGFIGIMTLIAG
ncbi:MAG: ABC transporter permease, partial [Bacteroidetes bacterium]|nr:ABC transporter permease [Bacteroidota bacterium]